MIGVRTDDKGIDKHNQQKSNFEPGYDLKSKVTILAEGTRGSLTKQLIGRFDLEKDRRSAALESARTDVTEARPGDEITIETVLRPYSGERIVRQIPVRVPTSAPKGTLRILISDAETLDRMRRLSPAVSQKLGREGNA